MNFLAKKITVISIVLISLFRSEDGFPQEQEKAYKKVKSKIKVI